MPPFPQSTSRSRRKTPSYGGCVKNETDKHLSGDGAESAMAARVADGEAAHVLEIKVDIDAVLPLHCDPAQSTHLRAGATYTVGYTASKLESPELTRKWLRGELAASGEPIPSGPGA